MRNFAPLPPGLDPRGFSVGSAIDADVRPGRLRSRDLNAPFWGVRAVSEQRSVADLAYAYASRMPDDWFFSHETAAALWGIPLPPALDRTRVLSVSSPSGRAFPSGAGVRGHRLAIRPEELVEQNGLRLTSRERTWCDLGSMLRPEHLVAAGDFLLWRRHPALLRSSPRQLRACLDMSSIRRGRPNALYCLPLLTDRSDSPPESILRVRYVRAGFRGIVPNPLVHDPSGQVVVMPDLGFLKFRVGIDYEGDIHRVDNRTWAKDLRRASLFEDAGWLYIRAGSVDLSDSRPLLALTMRRLLSRGYGP